MSRAAIAICVVAIALLTLFLGLLYGSVEIAPAQVLRALVGRSSEVNRQIVRELRLPRVLAAFACGGLLAVAGAVLQALLRNPLADPYILGVSGGASVGALSALTLGLSSGVVNGFAFAGAVAVIGLVFALSYSQRVWSGDRLLLVGVVLSAGLGAIVSLFLALSPQAQLRGMLFWLIGDLSRASDTLWPLIALLVTTAALTLLGRGLDLLTLGDLKAKSLGLNVTPFQIAIYLMAAVATTAAVVTSGSIGFVGLLVPHALRLVGIVEHRRLVPLAALAGGTFLTLADLAARTIVAPTQLPVGALTAILGVPLLLMLLTRKR